MCQIPEEEDNRHVEEDTHFQKRPHFHVVLDWQFTSVEDLGNEGGQVILQNDLSEGRIGSGKGFLGSGRQAPEQGQDDISHPSVDADKEVEERIQDLLA